MDKFINEVNVQKENYNIEDKFSCKKIKYKNQTVSPNVEQVIDLTSFIFGVHSVKVNDKTYYPNSLGEVDIGDVATLSDIELVNESINTISTQLLQKIVEEQNARIQSDKKINVSQSETDGYIKFTNSDGDSVDIWVGSSGSGGGTDYNNLANKPSINGEQLIGNKNGHDLKLANLSDLENKQDKLQSGITIKTINNQSLLDFGNLELQNKLESGVTIKTINGKSVLGSGNIDIQGGSGTSDYNNLSNKPSINGVELNGDKTSSDLDIPSKSDVNAKQDRLQSGINIKTINHQSIMGSGNINIEGGGGGGDVGIELTREEYIALRDSGQLLEDTDYYVIDDFTQGYPYVKTVNEIGIDGNSNVTIKTSDIENDSGYITQNDIPPIPTKTSDLENDSGYITENDIPTIPTKTSDLENDSQFQTESEVSSTIESSISPLQENITELNSNLNQEIIDRQNGDDTLQNNINDEIQTRTSSIQSLRNELNSLNQLLNTIQSRVNELNLLIPNEASEDNQLADKEFVNSSIATNTAYFKGTFTSVDELPTDDVTNNDYAFVDAVDDEGKPVYKRYKYNSEEQEWIYEYDLNNSSFTSEQWATINSGLTADSIPTKTSDLTNDSGFIDSNTNLANSLRVSGASSAVVVLGGTKGEIGRCTVNNVAHATSADSATSATNDLRINGSNGTSEGVSALINKLSEGTSTPADADYYVAQYAGGGKTTTSYHRRPVSALYNYIKGKLATALVETTTNGVKTTIGAQNGDWVHIYNSKGTGKVPFIFNSSVCTTGGDLGTGSYYYTNEYLQGTLRLKSDANYSGQVKKGAKSISWNQARDNAPLIVDTSSGYFPILSIKTTNGSWDIGHYNTTNWHNKLVFTYMSDANLSKNSPDKQITFSSDGKIEGMSNLWTTSNLYFS